MVATFPNMGNAAMAAAALFQALKIPYILPEQNNKELLETGAFYSPEEICLPFKLALGGAIKAVRQGADTVLITGSCGPCRFGEYCELQMKILRNMGYAVDFIILDLSAEVGVKEFLRRTGAVAAASTVSRREKLKGIKTAWEVLRLCEKIDSGARRLAGYEANKGDCKRLLNEYKSKIRGSGSPEETLALLKYYDRKLKQVEIDKNKVPLKIAVIGEIYTIVDEFSSRYMEELLMDCGASSFRTLSAGWWVKDMMLKPIKLNSFFINRAADKYLPFNVGGHGRECVGEAALAKSRGMDGAIQVFPLGCMPEIVAKSVLPAVRRDSGLPIMTLVVDEVTGDAGYITRVEAFLDMLSAAGRKGKASGKRGGSPAKNM